MFFAFWKALLRSSYCDRSVYARHGADPIRHTAVLVLMRVGDLGADQVVWRVVLTVKENTISFTVTRITTGRLEGGGLISGLRLARFPTSLAGLASAPPKAAF
jgi:hypothetical protein